MERCLIQGSRSPAVDRGRHLHAVQRPRRSVQRSPPERWRTSSLFSRIPCPEPSASTALVDDWDEDSSDDYLSFASTADRGPDGELRAMLLGERAGQLHAHMQGRRRPPRSVRNPDYLRLDNARPRTTQLHQVRRRGRSGHAVFRRTAATTGFAMEEQWRFAATGSAGQPYPGLCRCRTQAASGWSSGSRSSCSGHGASSVSPGWMSTIPAAGRSWDHPNAADGRQAELQSRGAALARGAQHHPGPGLLAGSASW